MNLVGPFQLIIFDDISSVVRLSALFSEGKNQKPKPGQKKEKIKKSSLE